MTTAIGEKARTGIWDNFCKGAGFIALGGAGYYVSSLGGMIHPRLSDAILVAGMASGAYGGSILSDEVFWPVKEKVETYFEGARDLITGYNVRTDKAIAAVVLSGSLPNALNSLFWCGATIASGTYLYATSDTTLTQLIERVANPGNFYSSDQHLHVDFDIDIKLDHLHFECGSVGAAYLTNQVKPEFASEKSLYGKTVGQIQNFLLQHPNVRKDAWKAPSEANMHETMMKLLEYKFAIEVTSAKWTPTQRACRAALLATNGKDFRHPPSHGFTTDQMNAFLRKCYNTATEEQAARARNALAGRLGGGATGVRLPG